MCAIFRGVEIRGDDPPYYMEDNPKRRRQGAIGLIDRSRKLWDAYCERPLKKNLVAFDKHLHVMSHSKSIKVKQELSRGRRASNREWKARGWKRVPATRKRASSGSAGSAKKKHTKKPGRRGNGKKLRNPNGQRIPERFDWGDISLYIETMLADETLPRTKERWPVEDLKAWRMPLVYWSTKSKIGPYAWNQPVVVVDDFGLVDGYHRVAKAIEDGHPEELDVLIFDPEDLVYQKHGDAETKKRWDHLLLRMRRRREAKG